MSRIVLDLTERSPEVDFNFEAGHFSMKGESYPENAADFFGPLLRELRNYIDTDESDQAITADFQMSYFNSSSAKALMNIFLLLERLAAKGRQVVINWHHHADDDTMAEFGEDFAEDIEHAAFNLCLLD